MEKPLRKSTRARSVSEHYVSVECRVRCSKNNKRQKKITTEIKQEAEDESVLSSCNITSALKSDSPRKEELQKTKKSPRKSSTSMLKVQIKDEPMEEQSGSSKMFQAELSSINDDVEFIQQSMKDEFLDEIIPSSKKQVKNKPNADGHSVPKKQNKKKPNSNEHKCETCGRTYKYRKGMLQHQRLECNLEPQFPCPYCPQKFRYRHQIQKHVFEQHNQAFSRWYKLFYLTSVNTNPRFVKKEKDTFNY